MSADLEKARARLAAATSPEERRQINCELYHVLYSSGVQKLRAMPSHPASLDEALGLLNSLIDEGMEFPDAVYRVTRVTGADQSRLEAAYDDQFQK